MKNIDIHQVNVSGLGAIKFSKAIVRDVLKSEFLQIRNLYFNKLNFDTDVCEAAHRSRLCTYRLPGVSRVFEIFFWRFYRNQDSDILVLGDLPLNTRAKQYVLCQQSLIFKKFPFLSVNFIKFGLFRLIFKWFIKKNDVVLVQNSKMKSYIKKYLGEMVCVEVLDLASESFGWPDFYRRGVVKTSDGEDTVSLIYPAAFVPHKNHHLLSLFSNDSGVEIVATVDEGLIASDGVVRCVGQVSRDTVFCFYKTVDGLIFLSSNESLGMPILEAIKSNLPIICPYAEYTEELPSGDCIFFDLNRPSSLIEAVEQLRDRLASGWWPQWDFGKQLSRSGASPIEGILLR